MRTSDEVEHETAIPKSELTQQQRTSLWCPRSTCMGPSIRHLQFFSINMFDEELLLVEGGVPVPAKGSDTPLVRDTYALRILHSNTVVSRDPVTR